jgi:preprotein translocase subunit SecY
MRKRVLAVVGILIVFRLLAEVPVPISDPQTLRQVLNNLFNSPNTPQLLGFVNVLSGGALANFSILIAGLGPYINASIIMQMLTKAIPQLEAMHKEGEYGQKRINQYTRMLTLPLAIAQSIGSIFLIRQAAETIGGIGDITAHTSILQWVIMISALTGGSMLLMWLGELITEQGLGNGISLLITIGIVSRLPETIVTIGNEFLSKNDRFKIFGHTIALDKKSLLAAGIFVIAIIILTWLVVKLNEAARNVTINYAKRVQGNRAYGGITTVLPIKLVTAGVIPIIFAVAFLSVPSFAGQLLTNSHNVGLQHIGTDLTAWFQPPTVQTFSTHGLEAYIYPVVYFLLVFLFTFFYTSVAFNSNEIAENLQKQGGFIEGVRSGSHTEKYLSKVINRLTLFGAISLGMLALVPVIAQIFIGTSIAIGGTSILILVSVSLQTLRAIESRALMVTYDQYSESDFFTDMEPEAVESTKKRRFSLIPFRRSK